MHKLLITLLSLVISLSATIKTDQVIGVVKIIDNHKIIILKVGQEIKLSAIIRTYKNAKAQFVLPDGSKVTIGANKTVAVTTLIKSGEVDKTKQNKFNLTTFALKLKKNNDYIMILLIVAGIRGAEKGKKVAFGVRWQNNKSPQKINTVAKYSQAQKLFIQNEYENAVTKLLEITSSKDDQLKGKAYQLLSQSYIELLEYDKAIDACNSGIKTSSIEKLQYSFFYDQSLCYFLKGEYKQALNIITKSLTSNSTHKYYWSAKVLTLYSYLKLDNKRKAKNVKKEITLNCTDQEIIKSISTI
jgi:tetratricopeptide (TPR) repeat protein